MDAQLQLIKGNHRRSSRIDPAEVHKLQIELMSDKEFQDSIVDSFGDEIAIKAYNLIDSNSKLLFESNHCSKIKELLQRNDIDFGSK